MNKIKATKTEMRNNYRILSVGYCEMQHLLAWENPMAYSAGHYGWSCDYYLIKHDKLGDIIISTGYSPIASKNMKEDYKLIQEYDALARHSHDRDEHKKLIDELLSKLLVEE